MNPNERRLRGWVIKILYRNRPDPIELAVLSEAMDGINQSMTRREIAITLDYLRQKKLLRVFFLAGDELSEKEQSVLMQRYAKSESDADVGGAVAAKLTENGIDFQDGLCTVDGVSRVE
ncbi:MAG TPA: hypothetical protein VI756_04955 [Blastocatellia bacterium]